MIHRRLLPLLASLAAAAPAAAHPGHGDPAFASSWLHYVLEPLHVVALVAMASAASFLARRLARSGRRTAP
jgi:hypothetical protein